MHSLFDALLAQHARQLTTVRCAHSTIAQLHRYFEDVVLENNLNALVIESLPSVPKRSARQIARIRDLTRGGRRTFFFVGPNDETAQAVFQGGSFDGCAPEFLSPGGSDYREHFVVIADARFSALLATVRSATNDETAGEDEVVWTFDPDVVYSALEYLMARVKAEHPHHAEVFGDAVQVSMPKATSLQLTLSVTTKLAHLLQEQAGREIAVNRIATAIRESLELGEILQKTVTEVGAALNVAGCALRVESQTDAEPLSYSYFASETKEEKLKRAKVTSEFQKICSKMSRSPQLITRDGSITPGDEARFPLAVVPLVLQDRFIGALEAIDDDLSRIWQENEILLLRTVANQVAVAINHAHLYAQMQQLALTDSLTGCCNRRSFEQHLDREVAMALRYGLPFSLLLVDLDHFKQLNDQAGHNAGDIALRSLGECLRQHLRVTDTAARFGGDEFALILPQANADGALIVAERLRRSIEKIEVPGYGHLSASIGVAVFPDHTALRAELVSVADKALYTAKRDGRGRVAVYDSAPDSAAAQSSSKRKLEANLQPGA